MLVAFLTLIVVVVLASLYLHDNQFDNIEGICDKSWYDLVTARCDLVPVSCSCCTRCCTSPGYESCQSL